MSDTTAVLTLYGDTFATTAGNGWPVLVLALLLWIVIPKHGGSHD